ncbi:MAG: hypothetical protein I3J03_08550 [Actinomyces succiniciruminis]|uniref:Mucin-2 n=1 Tax=Actinomyces succiniciruminis TaxID=1522002 RepID=A0A1L7RP24_9ACTO|nr:hypothetical protein [Actinomyces succiniciruminis]MBM6979750.1 hypothetical protein [Actinomyces succiniciruminis]CED91054.1 Mucin-2 [Actinomyces succiniciruminis]
MITSRRAFFTGATATALAAALAACSQDVPTNTATGTPTPQPVLDSDRLTAVLERVQAGLDAADADKNADALAGYLTGPAARVRGEEYQVASATEDDSFVHTFTTTSQAGTVALANDFPRTVLTITDFADDEQGYLLALTQDSARDNYQLWAWAQLFAGVEIPSTYAPAIGTEQIAADDATDLAASPQEVLDAYVDALNDPDGENGKAFADDVLRQRIAAERAVDLSEAGEINVTAKAGADGFNSLRTADGGVITMTTLTFSTVYKKTVAGANLSLTGSTVGALMGDNQDVAGTVTANYDVMIAFLIPAADAEDATPTALGMDLVLASVSRDDSQAPAEEDAEG